MRVPAIRRPPATRNYQPAESSQADHPTIDIVVRVFAIEENEKDRQTQTAKRYHQREGGILQTRSACHASTPNRTGGCYALNTLLGGDVPSGSTGSGFLTSSRLRHTLDLLSRTGNARFTQLSLLCGPQTRGQTSACQDADAPAGPGLLSYIPSAQHPSADID